MPATPFGLDLGACQLDLADPRLAKPGMLRRALNLLPRGGILRTVPGNSNLYNRINAGGTPGKTTLSIIKPSYLPDDSAIILPQNQAAVTGTATSTSAGRLVDSGASFHPGLVGRVVKNTTDSTITVVTGFVNTTTMEVSDDIFVSGKAYSILTPGDVLDIIPYWIPGVGTPSDQTILGEIDQVADLSHFVLQGRVFMLAGEARGYVLHGDTFRPSAFSGCLDNNGLSVDASQGGQHTGRYKFALAWYDAGSQRVSPALLLGDEAQEDGYYNLSGKKLVLTWATLPGNVTDTWTHYRMYVKKKEWADYHYAVQIEKTAGAFEENVSDAVLLARETLVGNRIAPSGWQFGLRWEDRAVWWLHHGLTITGGVSLTYGSNEAVLSGAYTAAEWMIGARLYGAASGQSLLKFIEVKAVKNSATLILWSEWDAASIANGDGRLVPYPSRVQIGLNGYADCEFTSPYHFLDVRPDDGDMVTACFVLRGDLYILKRNSFWRVLKDTVVDQLGEEIPMIGLRTELLGDVGCCGPRALAQDGQGTVYWLNGTGGLYRFGGGAPERVIPRNAQIDPYFAWQEETELWNVRMCFNPIWQCMEIHGLSREGKNEALRYLTREDKFMETDIATGKPFVTVSQDAPSSQVANQSEYVYFTASLYTIPPNWTAVYEIEIWRARLIGDTIGTPEVFVNHAKAPGVYPTAMYAVRDMTTDRQGNLLVLWDDWNSVFHSQEFDFLQRGIVQKYSQSGNLLWGTENIIKYIWDREPGSDVHITGFQMAIGDRYACIAAHGNYHNADFKRRLWVILIDLEDGALVSFAHVDTAVTDLTHSDYWDCHVYTMTWSPDGKFWIPLNYRSTVAGIFDYPGHYSGRVYWFDQGNLSNNGYIEPSTAEGSLWPLSVAYHSAGYLVMGVWRRNATTKNNEIGVSVRTTANGVVGESFVIVSHTGEATSVSAGKLIDSNAAFDSWMLGVTVRNAWWSTIATCTAVDSPTQLSLSAHIFPMGGEYIIHHPDYPSSNPDPSISGWPQANYCVAGGCGIDRTGQRAAMFEQLRSSLGGQAAEGCAGMIWFTDGIYLWKIALSPFAITPKHVKTTVRPNPTGTYDGLLTDYACHSLTRRANGDLVWLHQAYLLLDLTDNFSMHVWLTLADWQDGSEKAVTTGRLAALLGVNEAEAFYHYTAPPYNMYGSGIGESLRELFWAPFVVG